jgi:hypothetical protein
MTAIKISQSVLASGTYTDYSNNYQTSSHASDYSLEENASKQNTWVQAVQIN